MKLKCMINNQLHKIVQGTPFAEEFNETLDSGSIIISHTEFLQLKPYDDVFIWDADYTFDGFYDDKILLSGKEYTFNEETRKFEKDGVAVFYKHLLINNFTETMLNLKDLNLSEEEYIKNGEKGVEDYKPIYEYKIQLFSEAKGLETACAPNISVTQPLKMEKKVSTWEYLERYVKLYSPVYKKVDSSIDKTWKFEKKYTVSPTLKYFFEDSYAPDFSLNNPTLREILSKLMITKDLIPYVVNNVIYGMDITKRSNVPFNKDTSSINYITGNMSSSDFCDNLKKTYSDALSQDNSARLIEYLGFRNSDSALMTLDNMRLETRFPIYKINKIYMCYYKEMIITKEDGKLDYRNFLCKQDITPLVKLNTERNLLSQDWSKLENITGDDLKSIDQLKDYKMMTVGYDIGSKIISGWGTKYTYPKIGTFWEKTKTYIENIARNLNIINPYGIYTYEYLKNKFGLGEGNILFMKNPDVLEGMVTPFGTEIENYSVVVINQAQKLKSFIFEVDYQAFYNGTIIHSKDNGLDNITVNDNPSSSLTLLEQDGLFAKEKVNRFGNKGLTISARYKDKTDENGNIISAFSQMQELGQVYEDHNNKDVVIYHREYQIWENEIICIYYGMHDYVLKNYYTSVYARHRTWSLMPYSESVRRAENRKIMILLSKNKMYFENFENNDNSRLLLKKFDDNNNYLKSIFSAFEPSDVYQSINYIKDNQRLNYGYLTYNNEYYATDLNVFVSGNSLCMNISMPDNISAGAYIETINPDFSDEYDAKTEKEMPETIDKLDKYLLMKNVEDDYTGSKQKWWSLTDDLETGTTKSLGFYCCHTDLSAYYDSSPSKDDILKKIYPFLIDYPKLNIVSGENKNTIGNVIDIYKDNKELIDMTYQIEPISNDKDILFNQWLMKLSNLTGSYIKLNEDKELLEENTHYKNISFLYGYMYAATAETIPEGQGPLFFWKVKKEEFDDIEIGKETAVSGIATFEYEPYGTPVTGEDKITKFSFAPIILTKTSDSTIKLKGTANAIWYKAYDDQNAQTAVDVIEYNFNTFTHFFFFDEEMGENQEESRRMPDLDTHYWFMSNFSPTVTLQGKKLYYYASVGPGVNDDLDTMSSSSDVIARTKNLNLKATLDEIYDNKKYFKNMYVCTSKTPMKKTLVYDEYPFANLYDDSSTLYNYGDVVIYDNKAWKCIKSNDIPESFDSSKWELISTSIKNNHLYAKNKETNYWDNIDLKIEENVDIKDIFKISQEEYKDYINIDISKFSSDIQSVHFWYVDNGAMKFVFGVNVDSSDVGEIKIYLSMLSNRDLRVYSNENMLIGNVLNIIDENSPFYTVFNQYYDIPDNAPLYKVSFDEEIENFTYKITRVYSESGEPNKEIDLSKDFIHFKDKLRITINPDWGYEIKELTINGNTFKNGDVIEITKNLSIHVKVDVKLINISTKVDEGAILTLTRIASPEGNAPLGIISENDIIYFYDIIETSVEIKDGFSFVEFLVNGISTPRQTTLTMYDDVEIILNVEEEGFKTVWEGRWEYNFLENDGLNQETIFDLNEILGLNIELRERPIIITFGNIEVTYADDLTNVNSIIGGGNLNNIQRQSGERLYAGDVLDGGSFTGEEPYIIFDKYIPNGSSATSTRFLKFTRTLGYYNNYQCMFGKFVITKIEQYY